jgi:hypothetical protein
MPRLDHVIYARTAPEHPHRTCPSFHPPTVLPPSRRRRTAQDTCGVHNLHGMPGIFGALVGVLAAAIIPASTYGGEIGLVVRSSPPNMATHRQCSWQHPSKAPAHATACFHTP